MLSSSFWKRSFPRKQFEKIKESREYYQNTWNTRGKLIDFIRMFLKKLDIFPHIFLNYATIPPSPLKNLIRQKFVPFCLKRTNLWVWNSLSFLCFNDIGFHSSSLSIFPWWNSVKRIFFSTVNLRCNLNFCTLCYIVF